MDLLGDGDRYVVDAILKHVNKGVKLHVATFYILLYPEDLSKVRGRKEISRIDFRVVAKYLRTIYSVM